MIPSDLSPELTDDRLKNIAKLLVETRHEVLEEYDPDRGDDPYSLGTRSYAWCKNRLITKSMEGNWPWLRILNKEQFTFLVGDVPIRFYKGDHTSPTNRTLKQSSEELKQLNLISLDSKTEDLKFRFAIETDNDGRVLQVTFVGINMHGDTEHFWEIPFETDTDILSEISETKGEPVEYPSAQIGIKNKQNNETKKVK